MYVGHEADYSKFFKEFLEFIICTVFVFVPKSEECYTNYNLIVLAIRGVVEFILAIAIECVSERFRSYISGASVVFSLFLLVIVTSSSIEIKWGRFFIWVIWFRCRFIGEKNVINLNFIIIKKSSPSIIYLLLRIFFGNPSFFLNCGFEY